MCACVDNLYLTFPVVLISFSKSLYISNVLPPPLSTILGPMVWGKNCQHCPSYARQGWRRRRRRRSFMDGNCSRRRWPREPESLLNSVLPLSPFYPLSLGGENQEWGRNPLWQSGQHCANVCVATFWSWTLSKQSVLVHHIINLPVRHEDH